MKNYAIICLAVFMQIALNATAQKGEFIYETAPFPSCHASTIVELPNGDILAAWFGGTAEKEPDVAIWGSRKTNGKWSEPSELVRERETPCWNPVYFYTNDKRLWLYYKYGTSPSTWTAGRKYSDDDGKTWSEIEHLPAGLLGPIRAKPLVLQNGVVVSGSSVESYRSWAVWIERSVDNGKTFSKIGPISVPENYLSKADGNNWKTTDGIIQPSVVWLGGKHLRLYARSTPRIGKICIADSYDEGLTWTQAKPIDVQNPNSGIDALELKDGRIILIYNNTNKGRSPLNLAISKDGEHFKLFYDLENTPGEFSYPNVIQGKNGDLHIIYTWNRKKIKYVNFKLADIPNP